MKANQLYAALTICYWLLVFQTAQAQNFIRHYQYGVPESSAFYDVSILTSGNYVCTGKSQITPLIDGIVTVVYSPTGQVLHHWESGHDTGLARAVCAHNDGGYSVIGGQGNNGVFTDFALIRFNSRGDSLRNWIGNPQWRQGGSALVKTNDDGVAAAGTLRLHSTGVRNIMVVRLDEMGDSIWGFQKTLPLEQFPTDIINTADGGFLIVGQTGEFPISFNPFALKLDANGNEEWYKEYNSNIISRGYEHVKAIDAPNGEFLITYTHGTPNVFAAGAILRINAQGDSLDLKLNVGPAGEYRGYHDIAAVGDGSYIVTGTRELKDSTFYIWLVKLNSQLDTVWSRIYGDTAAYAFSQGSGVEVAGDGGFVVAGEWSNEGAILKTDALGNIHYTILQGSIVHDRNNNCNVDSGETYLSNQLINISVDGFDYYSNTNSIGQYNVDIYDTGQVFLNWVANNSYWNASSCQTIGYITNNATIDTLNIDIFTIPITDCPELTVSLNTPFIRRCFSSAYTVNYCNNGTLPANSAYIEIEMDPYLTVDSASVPWVVPQQGNLYRFNVDTVGIGQCSSFNIWVTVDCGSTELGQTHCVSAHIYPDSICLPPDSLWDGSSVAVSGTCDFGDTLDLKIENVGAGNMTSPSFFLIAEDNVMYNSGNFQLQAGDSLKFRFKGNGSTFTLLADQVEGHPGNSFPMVSIEGCGVNNQGTFSTGFVTQYPQDDQNGYVDVLCLQNVASYDPNDKRPEPLGLENEGYVTATQPLDYTIRFQNTGTDTAFTVVLRDTLSPYLDITTLYLTGASHPYTFQIIGSNVLEWTFANILLPDSNVNEPLSHGFVSFHIQQQANNPVGTEITNRAGIYFDFNAVVLTNTTLNTIIADYKAWFTFVQSPESTVALGIYPNPNNGTFSLDFVAKPTSTYEFAIYDLAGAKQFGQTLTDNAP